ncbi:MAG: hypothetical protein ACI92S_003317, partial [Planctomycetaceae bacterium]
QCCVNRQSFVEPQRFAVCVDRLDLGESGDDCLEVLMP